MRPNEEQTRDTLRNTVRDEGTTGKNQQKADQQPGLADEDTPQWRPPEADPEPRPPEPIMNAQDGAPPAQI